MPDPSKSIKQNAIEPWSKPHYRAQLAELKRAAQGARPARRAVDRARPTTRSASSSTATASFEGVQGFFRWLERKKYKVHVRVFLSRYRGYLTCPECGGTRLRREARDVRVGERTIDVGLRADRARGGRVLRGAGSCRRRTPTIADKVLREIRKRLGFLRDVGLDYLTLDRLSSTLSGGESQRINLATSLGSALVDTLYVLDEPSIGLHSRDNQRLIAILRQLRDQGNTVLVVEHDADMIRVADTVVDMGLGAGEQGGRVVFSGTLEALLQEPRSLTAKYLRDELAIPVPASRRSRRTSSSGSSARREHNLKDVDVEIPLGMLTCVTGVSGSGKTTLVHDVIYAALKRAKGDWDRRVGTHRKLEGAEFVTDVVLVDQAPIGRTPRSNPVTYLKAFDPIRELFAATKDAQVARPDGEPLLLQRARRPLRGLRGRRGGQGRDAVPRRRLRAVRAVRRQALQAAGARGQVPRPDIDQVLDLTVREALTFFSSSPKVLRRLQVLDEIGLGYLRLGQPATTLSGGEAQRIKIAAHLSSQTGERVLYILDEPTTGLHFDDIAKLLAAFRKLLQAGHSLLVIEHNLDVIKTADWIIDLGPEGGDEGGRRSSRSARRSRSRRPGFAHRPLSARCARRRPHAMRSWKCAELAFSTSRRRLHPGADCGCARSGRRGLRSRLRRSRQRFDDVVRNLRNPDPKVRARRDPVCCAKRKYPEAIVPDRAAGRRSDRRHPARGDRHGAVVLPEQDRWPERRCRALIFETRNSGGAQAAFELGPAARSGRGRCRRSSCRRSCKAVDDENAAHPARGDLRRWDRSRSAPLASDAEAR